MQLANHEVGTVQTAVAEIVATARERGITVHVDACAAAGHLPVRLHRRSAPISARSTVSPGAPPRVRPRCWCGAGCGSPRSWWEGRRSARGEAGSRTCPRSSASAPRRPSSPTTGWLAEAERARTLTDAIATAATSVPGVVRFGDPEARLPNLVCVGIEGVEAEPIVLGLDQHGVAVHSGSSCSSELLEPSPVLQAMGVDADRSLRASVGWSSTADDVEQFARAFPEVVERLRALRGR